MKRPEYEKHIMKTNVLAVCGAELKMEWAFVDIDHALKSQETSRFTICPVCLEALKK